MINNNYILDWYHRKRDWIK